MHVWFRRAVRGALAAAGIVAIALVLAELALDAAALFAHDREDAAPAREGARRVVCVGDSHTYGALVPAEESYPAQLQRLLDAREPGAFAVVNLGVPGFNTALTRARLQTALARYRPEVVVVWAGVNDSWNHAAASTADASWLGRLDAVAVAHLRLYRLLRTRLHDRALEAALAAGGSARPDIVGKRTAEGGESVAVVGDGRSEEIAYAREAVRVDPALEDLLLATYRGMVDDAHAAGARIVFVAYPSERDAFTPPNRALRRLWAETGVPVVDAWPGVQRVPAEQRQMLWAGHPNGPMYAEIAKDVLPAVLDARAPVPPDDGLLVALAHATGAPLAPTLLRGGPCPYDGGPYRWNPAGGVCFLEQPLAIGVPAARLTARLRIDDLPHGADRWGGYNLLGLFEPVYGTGVYAQLVPPDRLRLFVLGGATGGCGPLSHALVPGRWYGLTITARKGEPGSARLSLTDDGGAPVDTVACEALPTGGGDFLHVRVGSADPGAEGAAEIADVAVRRDADAD